MKVGRQLVTAGPLSMVTSAVMVLLALAGDKRTLQTPLGNSPFKPGLLAATETKLHPVTGQE